MSPPIFRFAPTPNGRLHLGHAYSALCNAEWARADRWQAAAAHRGHRSHPMQARIRGRDFRGSGLARGRVRRRRAPAERAFRRLRPRAGVAAGARPRLSLLLHARRDRVRQPRQTRSRRRAAASRAAASRRRPREIEARLAAGEPAAMRLDMARARRLAPREPRSGANSAKVLRSAASRRRRKPGAMSCCAARAARRPIISRSSSTTRCRASATSCAAAISSPSTSVHRLLQALLGLEAPRYRHHRLVLDAAAKKCRKARRRAARGLARGAA